MRWWPGFRSVNNGRLGGACNADGTNDGTCIEVEAGEGDWVGLCIEGGTQAVGQSCLSSRRPETTTPTNASAAPRVTLTTIAGADLRELMQRRG